MNFDEIEYLRNGNEKQKHVYGVLTRHAILNRLAAFEPIVVGTIPIGIDIDSSDIDIICYSRNESYFYDKLESIFKHEDHFQIRKHKGPEKNATIANFKIDGFEFEIFGQNLPTKSQISYRHMLIEYNVLKKRGDGFRKQVIELKKQGLKTEPAFAQLLGLEGDPYSALLTMG